MIALAIETDDEHGASMAVAGGLVGSDNRTGSTLGRGVAETFAETTVAEFVGAAKKFDGIVRIIGS
jgi:hypothetical protein